MSSEQKAVPKCVFCVRLDEETINLIRRIVADEERTASTVVRRAMQAYVRTALTNEAPWVVEDYKRVCGLLQDAVQRHKLGLGGEDTCTLVVEALDESVAELHAELEHCRQNRQALESAEEHCRQISLLLEHEREYTAKLQAGNVIPASLANAARELVQEILERMGAGYHTGTDWLEHLQSLARDLNKELHPGDR